MRFRSIKAAGLRGFNEEQTIDLSDPLIIFEGPNGSGKTSLGEAIEWLLFGKTLKQTKGEELSKREYSGCYKNAHFTGDAFVEAEVDDVNGKPHKLRRELLGDAASLLTIDGAAAPDLRAFGINTVYDRPLILQHTLQDFIFMKPKARYEVLSSMMGLDSLIAFRNTVESAKTAYGKRLPQRVVQAQSKRTLLVMELRQEPVLVPVAKAIEAGKVRAAKQHLLQVAEGLVPPGTARADFVQALRVDKDAKERAQLDWGKYSASVIDATAETAALKLLVTIDGRVTNLRARLAEAVAATQAQSHHEPSRRQFYGLGLHLLDDHQPTWCPFCAAASLTPERVAAIRKEVVDASAGLAAIEQARKEVQALALELTAQAEDLAKLVPKIVSAEDRERIRDLAGAGAQKVLDSADILEVHVAQLREAYRRVSESRKGVESALGQSAVPHGCDDLAQAVNCYAAGVRALPALVNAYAANHNLLDQTIRARLAQAADVKKVERIVKALEQWQDVEIYQAARTIENVFNDLLSDTKDFIKNKQKQVLGCRDKEVKDWYNVMNPGSDVAYDGIVPGTDMLELRAKTFTKSMAAAPNLSSSQLNCVGIAVYLACATRPGTPFRTLLIDDPVQSMDDEHTEAFKKQVIAKLLKTGYHVIVLTHMQQLATGIESLYRSQGAVLYKMNSYAKSGPSMECKGPEVVRLLQAVRRDKDGASDQFRVSATVSLRRFIESFVKDLFRAQTKQSISRRYEDKSWGELRELLRRCPGFDANDEALLEDTFTFASRHMHSDETVAQPVAPSAHITPHYMAMRDLLSRYRTILGISYTGN